MGHPSDIAFSDAVKAEQERLGPLQERIGELETEIKDCCPE